MKSQFAHFKNRAKGTGIRGLAIVLCFVMLLTAVGAGTMMTAFATKSVDPLVTDAAQKVVDIAATVDTAAEDTEEDQPLLPVLTKKVKDLAETGAKFDLAETGATTYYLWAATSGGNSASNYSSKGAMTNTDGVYTKELSIGSVNFDIFLSTSSSTWTTGFKGYDDVNRVVQGNINTGYSQVIWSGSTSYKAWGTNRTNDSVSKVYITYDSGSNTLTISSTGYVSGSGSGSGSSGSDSTTRKIYIYVISYVLNGCIAANTTTNPASANSHVKLHYWGGADGTKDVSSTYTGTTKLYKPANTWNTNQTFYKYETSIPSDATGMKAWVENASNTSTTVWFGNNGDPSTNNAIYVYQYSGDKADYTSEAVTYNGLSAKLKFDGTEGTKTNFSATLGVTTNVSGTDGTSATAVNGDATNYKFDGWTSANGTFTNASDLSTTFKPSADNAVAYANFSEKTYSVSVTSANTSYGTVSPASITAKPLTATNLSTITVTPKTGYKFNGWTTTGSVALTGNSADDATVGTIKATAAGGTLTANFTKQSYTLTKGNVSSGSGSFSISPASGSTVTYQDTVTVTTTPSKGYQLSTVTNNGTTISGVTKSGNTATFKMPAGDVTVNVTFSKKTYAISGSANPTAGGSMKVTNSGNTTTYSNWSIGATRYLRATANDAYDFSKFIMTYADGSTQELTTNPVNIYNYLTADRITDSDVGSISVVAYFTKKPTHKVTVKTNSVVYGTATASVTEAYSGQSVKLTATENTGTFSKWTVTPSTMTSVNNKTTNPLTFTMGDEDLTITANFTAYSGSSNFYYNGYNLNGETATKKTNYYGKRMTEAKINGEKYSYYHVTGRTEVDQLFTVSYGNIDYTNAKVYWQVPKDWNKSGGWGANEGQDVYFLSSDNVMIQDWTAMSWDSDDVSGNKEWNATIPDGARYAYFRANENKKQTKLVDLTTGNTFKLKSDTDSGEDNHHYFETYNSSEIGDVYENFNGTQKYTNNFTTGGFNTHDANYGSSHAYNKPDHLGESQRGDYYILVLYKDKTYTINGETKKIDKDPEIIWTKSLPAAIQDDTPKVDIYAKNGMLRDSTFNRFTNLANTDFDLDYFEYTETLDSGVYTYTSIADYNAAGHTEITWQNDYSAYNSNYAILRNVPVGAKIKLRTTLSSDSSDAGSFDGKAFKDTHYLKAYTFNGITYEVHTANDTGVYEEIWTVTDANTTKAGAGGTTVNLTKDGKAVEVTPIYYMKDNSNCMTFYIDGYDATVQGAWGNLLSVYPYYEDKSNAANAFGGYPGQPMLLWGGKYQMEIPLTVDGTATGATVKGLTLHNAYWDMLHRDLDLVCDKHAQTYDFDDFYKIYKEKNPDSIIFDFKYKTVVDNFNDGYEYTKYAFADNTASAATYNDASHNGVELLTDYYGRQVDAFGTLIADNKLSDWNSTKTQTGELLFVSTGYKDTYVGEYATIWAVYKSDGTFLGYISPSMLYLSSLTRVSQYAGGTSTAKGKMSWSEFSNTYTTLKNNYSGVPVLISYEKEILNDSKDKANRSDGKWYYSNKNDKISANIIIQYNSDPTESLAIVSSKDKALNDTAKWTDDSFSDTAGVGGVNNIGTTTKCAAYFTNTSPNLYGKVESGEQFTDSTKSFTFRADASGQYLFVNWVRYSNGRYYEISQKELAESVMSSNDTYIARFVKSAKGSLKISHVVETNDTYKGTGTPSVTVTVKNGDSTVFSQTSTDGTPIDISSYIATKYSAYKIDIALETAPDEDCTLMEIVQGSGKEKYNPGTISSNAATVAQFTVQDILTDEIGTLRYVSHLNTEPNTYKYQITYHYTSRFWGDQYYVKSGTLLSDNNEQMSYISGKKASAELTTAFITEQTPYEKNFRDTIDWNYTKAAKGNARAMTSDTNETATRTYSITVHVYSANIVNDMVTAELFLPYSHDTKANGYAANETNAYSADYVQNPDITEYVYDESQEAVPVTAQVYKLFTYDGSKASGNNDLRPAELPLVKAAPYVIKNATAHHYQDEETRYFTGTYFTIGTKKYYYNAVPDGVTGEAEAVTASTTCTWRGVSVPWSVIDNTDSNNPVMYSFKENGANGQYTRHQMVDKVQGVIENTGTKYYFTRWDIYDTSGNYVASSYDPYFNYSGYQNYRATAIYEDENPRDGETPSGNTGTPTITYLDDTRNQWTAGGNGTYSNPAAGDKLLTDFALSYDYYSEEIRTITNRDIKIGMIIEQLDELESAGGSYVTDATYYADKYKSGDKAFNLSEIQSALSSNSKPNTGTKISNVKIASNLANWGTNFNDTNGNLGGGNNELRPIDNMNRLQWYFTFNNTENNRNKVYRASAYIIDDGVAKVSSTPVYFTLYTTATR